MNTAKVSITSPESHYLDTPRPEISWKIQAGDFGFRQTAYQIVAKELSSNAVFWDSGLVPGNASQWIPWGGDNLKAGDRISLKVRIADPYGELSDFSEPVIFELARRSWDEWQGARWIWYDGNNYSTTAPSPYFRRTFRVRSGLERATLSITARGVFEASLDGKKISKDLLAPGWCDFKRRIPFLNYDLTDLLSEGEHTIGAILADGWCCGNLTIFRYRNFYHPHPELLAHLELRYADGVRESLVTDSTWRTATGPILSADIYDGEDYDARLEMPGWDTPAFDDSSWRNACDGGPVADVPVLFPKSAPSVRCMEERLVQRILNPRKDTFIWDFGQNFTGTFRVRLRGLRGRRYTFRTAEMLYPDGLLYTLNYRSARSQDTYICRGSLDSSEEYTPRFTFHGFRYLQIDGWQFDGVSPYELEVVGRIIHSDMKLCGTFSCGNELVSRLWENARWSQRGNFLEIPTDCPQRDERLGWTGDAALFAPAAMLNMDCRSFYRKYLCDIRDAMTEEGAAPSIAPAVIRISDGAAAWGDAVILIPYALYRHYGWKSILAENYDAMCRAIRWRKAHCDEELISPDLGFGDWLAPEPTSKALIGTAYFIHCLALLSEIAGILEQKTDMKRFRNLFLRARTSFRKRFFNSDGLLSVPTQTAYILAFCFDLIPEEDQAACAAHFEKLIRERNTRLVTGFLGTGLVMRALECAGLSHTACDLLLQEDYPSWLFSVKQGATTIWERWDSFSFGNGFSDPAMNSFNHYAYGAVSEFIIQGLGGIRYSARELFMKIIPDRRFSPVHAAYDSPHGFISSDWHFESDNQLFWCVTVPPGIPARAILPDGSVRRLSHGITEFRCFLHPYEKCCIFKGNGTCLGELPQEQGMKAFPENEQGKTYLPA